MTNTIVVLGSSRSTGDTWNAIQSIIFQHNETNKYKEIPVVDLNSLNISPYDYENRNKEDDYIPLMKRIITYNTIVLATPTYWYTMSAQMKIFIDRLSDLLRVNKDIGHKLRGKSVFIITTFATSMPEGFEEPFRQTCKYMGMSYLGCSFIHKGNNEEMLRHNSDQIEFAKKMIFTRSQ